MKHDLILSTDILMENAESMYQRFHYYKSSYNIYYKFVSCRTSQNISWEVYTNFHTTYVISELSIMSVLHKLWE
jgi:hypothetical protein